MIMSLYYTNKDKNITKLTGSSVNPLTPLPVERTTMVALPYMEYPAATIFLPGCRRSASQAGPSHTCIQ